MSKPNYTCTATDFVVYPPTFINCIPRIKTPLVNKIKACFERIGKIDMSLKKDFLKLGRKKKREIIHKNKSTKIKKITNLSVIAYPDSDITEILKIMNHLNITSIPIAAYPWNKKLIGYLEKDKLEKVIKGKLLP